MSINQAQNISLTHKELTRLINDRIERLRPKLLDLTRRNPLLSTRFSDRSNSHVRIIDTLPNTAFNNITDKKMHLCPLPNIDIDPSDEKSLQFMNAIADARLTDMAYINTIENIDQNLDDAADKLAVADRELKDRVRNMLSMPPRQTKDVLSLTQHAQNHGINPSYDLPSQENKSKDAKALISFIQTPLLKSSSPRQTKMDLPPSQKTRDYGVIPPSEPHGRVSSKDTSGGREDTDNVLQTLLLPDLLQKKLDSLIGKHKTWVQETGINVLRAAFGFLEWTDTSANHVSQICFAPLILLPIELNKNTTRDGFEYWVSEQGESPETNTILSEKLKRDFGIILPIFDPESMDIEKYFIEVGNICKKEPKWKIRRQIAIGVFPSARMAMYHDLDTRNWDFAGHDIVNSLFGSRDDNGEDLPYADEYEIDSPSIEAKVPFLVMDADSSQHSVIVDVMDKKSISVEGPPGTGKSQTIVNTIAAALSQGKTVLFVAEKMAALEVVRSRLESCKVGEFLLTLQANRSSKELVIQSIRDRLAMRKESDPQELDEKIRQFKLTRKELSQYIKIVTSNYAETPFTVHEILGWGMESQKYLLEHGLKNVDIQIPDEQNINREIIDEVKHLSEQLEGCWQKTLKMSNSWVFTERANIDPYTADKILLDAQSTANLYENCAKERCHLIDFSLDQDTPTSDLALLKSILDKIAHLRHELDLSFIKRVMEQDAFGALKTFLDDSLKALADMKAFQETIQEPLLLNAPAILSDLAKAMSDIGLNISSAEDAAKKVAAIESELVILKSARELLDSLALIIPEIKQYDIPSILSFLDIASSVGTDVLSLRSEKLAKLGAKETINRFAKKAETLKAQLSELEGIFHSIPSLHQEALKETLDTIKTSNIFSFLSPKYIGAKHYYKSIVLKPHFSKTVSIDNLENLLSLLDETQKYSSDEKIKSYIGDLFCGLETNFKPFIQLASFYGTIENHLKGIECGNLRKILYEGDPSIFINLPTLDKENALRQIGARKYVELTDQIASAEKKYVIYVGSYKVINDCLACLGLKRALKYNVIADIGEGFATKLQSFQSRWNQMSNNALMRDIFNAKTIVPMLLPASLETSFSILKEVDSLNQGLKQAILRSIIQNNIDESVKYLNSLIEADLLAEGSLKKLSAAINVDLFKYFTPLRYKDIVEYLAKAAKDREGLIAYSSLYAAKSELSGKGYKDALDILIKSSVGFQGLFNSIKALIGCALAQEVFRKYGNILTKYNGIKLDGLRKQFADLDKEIINLSRQRLRAFLWKKSKPPQGRSSGLRGEWTEMALLNNEIAKQKRHLPARELTKRASKALLELKPCWMMSPLAVAQYIQKGQITFDLLIVDEASQMTPEDAIGAIARARQSMVVGDVNQLPPTSFFKKYLDTTDEDEEDDINEESILEIANAAFRPSRQLKWHYRSRHPQLIAFSNKYVYDDKLIVFPSPDPKKDADSISLHKVNGLYFKGTNPIEAKELANEVIEFMHKYKEMSLGVVLLNQRQRELVEEEVDYRIVQDPIAQEYIEYWDKCNDGLESFFIKNLENVQGDERDVIIIGTVYGPEKDNARVMQRFGPINGINGKRRLNVLFSRAKKKIITFSSMLASDIVSDGRSNEGVELFKHWLEYCATGKMLSDSFLPEKQGQNKPEPSIFEEYVTQQLKSMGCEVVPQVGVSGYFIDIGVKHPKWPHGFIMGVECDGATYHSSKSARDRDRLRQEVLERLGWYIYRIWSTDWFSDPTNEAAKLRTIIDARLKTLLS